MAKDTEASQKKYEDMLNRPKTAFGSLKVMITGKDVEERKKKWKTNARKLTDARNDYLLAVEGINVLQASYYGNDLPNLMKRLDGTYYPTVSGLFTKYSAMEEAVSTDFSNSINLVKSRIPDIRRERDTGEFLQDYVTIFETPAQFSFEKYPSDDVCFICVAKY